MLSKTILTSALLALILAVSPVWAGPSDEEKLPRGAREIRKGVFDLGVAVEPLSGRPVRGKAFVHNRQNQPQVASLATCYGFIGGGVKWTANENFLFNASNRSGLAGSSLRNVVNAGLAKWEDAADGTLGNGGPNIVGESTLTSSRLRADYSFPDGRNEIYFGGISGGSIGVTVIWYTTTTLEIVETDQVYNDRSYRWSLSGEANRMDFDNIVTHEHGHVFGLEDQYENSCAEATMYGYADYGETKKRDLDQPDITGVDLLY